MRTAHIIIGLAFGDEGKGATTDFLVRETGAQTVMRYNGGPQAAHRVTTPDGRSHVFAQFGSGSFVPGNRTFISRGMCVDPPALLREAEALRTNGVTDAMERLTLDRDCIIVTPYHAIINRIRELIRGNARHGSCGRGVGQAVLDAREGTGPVLRVRDCIQSPGPHAVVVSLRKHALQFAEGIPPRPDPDFDEAFQKEIEYLHDIDEIALAKSYYEFGVRVNSVSALRAPPEGDLILEGAQGVLLDQDYGFFPYVTPSPCTAAGVRAILSDYLRGENFRMRRVGVLRAYGVRHGAGPFPGEAPGLALPPEESNGTNAWQGAFRLGWFDLVAARYALRAVAHANGDAGIDEIALTNLDRLRELETLKVCTAYEFAGTSDEAERFFEYEQRADSLVIRNVRIVPGAGREHRLGLTKALELCRPVFRGFARDDTLHPDGLRTREHSYIQFLQQELGKPIRLVSTGPGAEARMRVNF